MIESFAKKNINIIFSSFSNTHTQPHLIILFILCSCHFNMAYLELAF